MPLPDFASFLIDKKIDPKAFREGNSSEWHEWEPLYLAMGAKSFDHYLKYRFNALRRAFPLPVQPEIEADPVTAGQPAKAPLPRKKLPLVRPAMPAQPGADTADAEEVKTELPAQEAPPRKKLPLARPVMQKPQADLPETKDTFPISPSDSSEKEPEKPLRKKLPLAKPVMNRPSSDNQPPESEIQSGENLSPQQETNPEIKPIRKKHPMAKPVIPPRSNQPEI